MYLNKSGITSIPTLTFSTISTCSFCVSIAEIVQADLGQVGITVNVEALSASAQQAPYGFYGTEVSNANQIAPSIFAWNGRLGARDPHPRRLLGVLCEQPIVPRQLCIILQSGGAGVRQLFHEQLERDLHPGAVHEGAAADLQRRALRVAGRQQVVVR